MNILRNLSLKDKHTFHCECYADIFIEIEDSDDLIKLNKQYPDIYKKAVFLGEGSNMLFTKDTISFVIHSVIDFIKIINEDKDNIVITAGGGTQWDKLVSYCVENEYWGVENLSGIPSSCAVAPIQNIGAYGAEFSSVLQKVYGFNFKKCDFEIYSSDKLDFGYRKSLLQQMPEFFITKIEIKLKKRANPNLSYNDLKNKFQNYNPSITEIRQAILDIRDKKIPSPDKIGNAGSFFKNPICSYDKISDLRSKYPDISYYPYNNDKYKISAGWLIEKAGWKGYREGDAGVSSTHSLILVNYGNAKGKDILILANKIINSVNEQFGIMLTPEVKII